jgi:hypothetical protein
VGVSCVENYPELEQCLGYATIINQASIESYLSTLRHTDNAGTARQNWRRARYHHRILTVDRPFQSADEQAVCPNCCE